MDLNRVERAREIFNYADKHGIEKTIADFAITYDTVARNIRRYKQLIREESGENLPKILLFDIETLPMWVRVWGLYKQRIPINNVIEDWITLSWAAKWLMNEEIMSDILTPEEVANRDDKRIIKSIWNLIDQADIIIAHNLARFDIRKLNSRFMIHEMKPPSPYQMIDTLTHSQKVAAHTSHKLDWLGQLVRNEGKISTDYELWVRCEKGEQEALDYMLAYNKEDVTLLEEVYLWMRPWMRSHPNIGLYMEMKEPVCSHCGSNNIWEEGYYYTPAGKYASVRCECGAIGRIRTSALSAEQSKTLTRSTAR
ncbi:DNA polymerase I [uncultured Mediterranean phage]|nr:DNA polymerase I [uncultured Mediterranean phage]